MLANEFIRLPFQFVDAGPPGRAALGQGAQGLHAPVLQAHHPRDGPDAGDAGLGGARAARPEGEGPLGHSGGAPLRQHAIPTRSRSASSMATKAEAWLKEAGRLRTWPSVAPGRASAAASTRPAPAAWATIRRPRWWTTNCQVHDVDNVFVIDGSVHVTNGGFNPVLTIMAIAYYASETLVKTWKGIMPRRRANRR